MRFKKKPCVWNNVPYESQEAAAEALGIKPSTMMYRLRQGYTCDADMVGKRPVMWNGNLYESLTAAGKAHYVTHAGMHYRLRSGYICDEDLGY